MIDAYPLPDGELRIAREIASGDGGWLETSPCDPREFNRSSDQELRGRLMRAENGADVPGTILQSRTAFLRRELPDFDRELHSWAVNGDLVVYLGSLNGFPVSNNSVAFI
jgi:hypothetical protein